MLHNLSSDQNKQPSRKRPALGAMIILLLWLYLTALVILMGGVINAILDEESGIKKKAEDPVLRDQERSGTSREKRAN